MAPWAKLVRDRIPKIMRAAGATFSERRLDDAEAITALKVKLVEEAVEVEATGSRNDLVDELADVYEVIDELKRRLRIADQEIRLSQQRKQQERGGFRKAIWVESDE